MFQIRVRQNLASGNLEFFIESLQITTKDNSYADNLQTETAYFATIFMKEVVDGQK